MPVALKLSPTQLIAPPKDVEDELVIIENVQDYASATAQGCGNDNPYS
ncbi:MULTISPECIES: hypothetical protein [Streptomyces]|nr:MULTISPECIES: hypothetical protein [unclassified Streptomyces]MCY0923642.1 hypothetical protein [Streptomyces sp. H27-G5]MCY0945345.1 hypothetical protein [Streptomyces sp. H34-AA3]